MTRDRAESNEDGWRSLLRVIVRLMGKSKKVEQVLRRRGVVGGKVEKEESRHIDVERPI